MPYILTPRSATRDIWVEPAFPGAPPYGRHLLDDGTDVDDAVADGRLEQLDFVPRFRRVSGSRVGDMLWPTGGAYKLVSRQLVEILKAVGASGWSSYPAELVTGRGGIALDVDVVGLAVDGIPGADVRHADGHATRSILVSDRVYTALMDAGVIGFEVEAA